MRFADANPGRLHRWSLEPLSAKISFFLGNAGWKKDIPSYSKIVYRGLYPGIDMTYGGSGRLVKSEFLVSPGANPAQIRLEYSQPVSIGRRKETCSRVEIFVKPHRRFISKSARSA